MAFELDVNSLARISASICALTMDNTATDPTRTSIRCIELLMSSRRAASYLHLEKLRKDGIGKEWWDYSTEFNFRCGDPKKSEFFTSEET
jgi:hypothetical protein